MYIKTIDERKPILWIKNTSGESDDTSIVKFMQGLDLILEENGYKFTILHTPDNFELSSLSYKEIEELLTNEILEKLGYVKKDG
jgi:hypothetical protein